MFVKERKNLESEEEEKEVRGRGTLKNEKWEKVLGKGRMERRRKRLGKGRRRDEEGGKREGGHHQQPPLPGCTPPCVFPLSHKVPNAPIRSEPNQAKPGHGVRLRPKTQPPCLHHHHPTLASPRLASPSPTGNGAVTHLSALN